MPSSSGGDSVRSLQEDGCCGGSWNSSDEYDGAESAAAAEEPGLGDDGSPCSDACSLTGLVEERNQWLDRYWNMGDRAFREKLLHQASLEYPQLANVALPSCFTLNEEPQPPDCKQQ